MTHLPPVEVELMRGSRARPVCDRGVLGRAGCAGQARVGGPNLPSGGAANGRTYEGARDARWRACGGPILAGCPPLRTRCAPACAGVRTGRFASAPSGAWPPRTRSTRPATGSGTWRWPWSCSTAPAAPWPRRGCSSPRASRRRWPRPRWRRGWRHGGGGGSRAPMPPRRWCSPGWRPRWPAGRRWAGCWRWRRWTGRWRWRGGRWCGPAQRRCSRTAAGCGARTRC